MSFFYVRVLVLVHSFNNLVGAEFGTFVELAVYPSCPLIQGT